MLVVEERFEHLSPMLDDAITFIEESNLSGDEIAALASLSIARISMGSVIALLRQKRGDSISQEDRHHIMKLLRESTHKVDELMNSSIHLLGIGVPVK